jgi:predicted nucleic acid-binding protein
VTEEKLLDRKADPLQTAAFLGDVDEKGICVLPSSADILPLIPADPDDDIVLACAVVGQATHLVTYDPHIHALGETYQDVRILDGLHFLYTARGDAPPVS